MKILVATNDETGIVAAAKLTKHGFETHIYTTNPYVESKANQHSALTHRGLSKPEFIKLCAERKYNVTSSAEGLYDEIWLVVNTIREGKDELVSAETLVRSTAETISETKAVTLTGLTKPGEAQHLLDLFNFHSKAQSFIQRFVGGFSVLTSCFPIWRSDKVDNYQWPGFNLACFEDAKSAEAATLSIILSQTTSTFALVETIANLGVKKAVEKCVSDDFLFYPEHMDVLKFYKNHNPHSIVNNAYRKTQKILSRLEKEALSQISAVAKKSRKPLRILVIAHDEAALKKLTAGLRTKNVSISAFEDTTLSPEELNSFKGFDGVLIESARLDLLRELNKLFDQVWYVPWL